MSEEEIRRGQQGVQGIQGIEGEPGKQGKPGEGPKGERGLSGAAGARGERGRVGSQPRSVILSFWAIVVVASLVLAGLAYVIHVNRSNIRETQRLAVEGKKAHDALCALNNELRASVGVSRAFLIHNPDGIPGIPASVIRQGIKNQQKAVDAVAPFLGPCPADTKHPATQ